MPATELLELLNDLRVTQHMPLATERFTAAGAEQWARDKDAQWLENGYGPWAIHVDGAFAGWGGFQEEGADPDFALVLKPAFWGHGRAIFEAAVRKGFDELGFESIVITLPPSRKSHRAVRRRGFLPDGDADRSGQRFNRFRLFRSGAG